MAHAVFTLAELFYILCFILAWESGDGFIKYLYKFFYELHFFPSGNFLLLMPVISSLTQTTLTVLEKIQERFQITTGFPPISSDPLVAYLELAWSPIVEEVVFRALPLGVFYAFYLNREYRLSSVARKLKVALLSFLSPEAAKRFSETKGSSKTLRKIDSDEWTIIIFSSALFALSHYLAPNTWGVGKITLAFIQGFIMALCYVIYGLYASILIHWYFNYYLYTNSLVTFLQSNLSPLSLLSETLPIALTLLTLTLLTLQLTEKIGRTSPSILNRTPHRFLIAFKSMARAKFKSVYSLLGGVRKSTSGLALLAVVVLTLGLRLAIIEFPKLDVSGGGVRWDLIFDERYYVSAARDMLNGKAANNEHPPLAKVFVASGLAMLGDNPVGWRTSAILSSSISIVLIYVLSSHLCGRRDVSLCSAMLFAFDIMAFNLGQIALLDAPAMAFVLAASVTLLKGRYDLSGLFIGLASLCKLSSIFVYVGPLLFLVFVKGRQRDSIRGALRAYSRSVVMAMVVFLVGLWLYDSWYSVFSKNPLGHISYMLAYHSGLKYQDPADVILPLQWINPFEPFAPMPFYVLSSREVAYYGIYTPLWWSIWIIMPPSVCELLGRFKRGETNGINLFTLLWILASFSPYLVLAYLMSRWVYPFYFYFTLPGLYVALAYHANRGKHSKAMSALLVLLQMFWFVLWFPVKPKVVVDFFMSLGLPV